jgi:hypothetical protein
MQERLYSRGGSALARILAFLCLCSAVALADAPVSGNVKDLGLAADSTLVVRFEITNCDAPKVGTTLVGTRVKDFHPDGTTGAYSGVVPGNDETNCDGVTDVARYNVSVLKGTKTLVPERRYHVLKDVSFNPASATAENATPPDGSLDYAIRNGDNTWKGTQDFTGATLLGVNGGPGGGAPTTASYITTVPETGLSNETLWSAMLGLGALASRPASDSTKPGKLYCTNDTGQMRCTRDSGSTWVDLYWSWNWIEGKPSTFAPSAHTHPESEVTSLVADLAAKEAVANKSTATDLGAGSPSNTLYPSQAAVKSYVDTGLSGKQNSLGYTAENVANKSTATDLGAGSPSNTLYPSQAAVKSYADAGLVGKPAKPIADCHNATTDKIIYDQTGNQLTCATDQTGVGGTGITTLNTLTATTQTMDSASDTNVTLTLSQSSSSNHRFSVAWAGTLAKARQHAATVYNDQANTFGAFLQKFQAGSNFRLTDTTDLTKGIQFDVSALSTATFRQIKVPDSDIGLCPVATLDGQICIWDAANSRYAAGDPIISPDQAAATTQSITATGALTAVDVTRHPLVLITLRGTYAGIAATFEGSPDATNYFTLQAVRLDSGSIESSTGPLTNTTRGWLVAVPGMTRVRLNVSSYTSGTGSVTITPLGMTGGGAQTVQVATMPTTTVTSPDNQIVTLGAKADARSAATDTTSITAMQVLKEISFMLQNPATTPVSGVFWQTTQPGSIADGQSVTFGAKADARSTATDATAITAMQVLKQISFMLQNPATTPVSAASFPLPSGAATSAKQPALGTAGSPSTDVLSMQGVSGGTPVPANVNQVGGNATVTPDNGVQGVAALPTASSTGAVSVCNVLSAASTNSTSCKGSAGNFYGYELYNTSTTVYYLRLYNSSTAPTCSSATGFIRSIPIPPAGAAGGVNGAISNQQFPVAYSTGIGYCITGGSSSTDNTSAATGVFGEIRFK